LGGRSGVAGEDEAFGEGGIEATMVGFGEPDEVFRTIVGGDAVEVVTFEVRVVMGTMPSGGDEEVNEVGVLWRSNDFIGLFASIVDATWSRFDESLREFSKDSNSR
jgi:hypothetical protein